MNVVQEFLNRKPLTEISSSTMRVSKATKRKRLAGNIGMRLAKQRRDPAYQKYMRFRKMMLQNKKRLQQRYARRGMSQARREYW